jgi:hypothetical protein
MQVIGAQDPPRLGPERLRPPICAPVQQLGGRRLGQRHARQSHRQENGHIQSDQHARDRRPGTRDRHSRRGGRDSRSRAHLNRSGAALGTNIGALPKGKPRQRCPAGNAIGHYPPPARFSIRSEPGAILVTVLVWGKLVERKLSILRRSSAGFNRTLVSIARWFQSHARFQPLVRQRDYFTRLATNSSVAKSPTFRVNFISSPETFPVYSMRSFVS